MKRKNLSLCDPRRGFLGEVALVTVLDFCLRSSEVKCEATPWLMRKEEIQASDSETLDLIAGWLTQYRKCGASC